MQERLIDGADSSPDAPFLVDIGGNVGHDLKRFQSRYPNVSRKLILQDLPMMIDQIKDLDPAIIRMGYDFHDEQPVKGTSAELLPVSTLSISVLNGVAYTSPRCPCLLYTLNST